MKLIVLIMAYNEEEKIADVIKRIPKKISKIKTIKTIVINDGSTDKTEKKAEKAGAVVVSHKTNLGLGFAFQTGLDIAIQEKTDLLVNIDADGQFNPNEINKLIKPLIKHQADFVCGDRFTTSKNILAKPKSMPSNKYYGNLLMSRFISLIAGQKFNDVSCGFRAYSKRSIMMLNLTGKFTYTQESFLDLAQKKLVIKSVPISVKYYKDRKSKVANNLYRYSLKAFKIIIRSFRDYKPFIFFSLLALIPAIITVFAGIFITMHYLATNAFTPYKFIGFIAIYSFSLTIFFLTIGFLADMFVRLRINQEKIIYLRKIQKN